jgi:DNA invertase Pin-like site-specific DNA recombinase
MLAEKEYVDSCISGNTPHRPAFTQLLHDAEMHAMDCIVMTNATRLYRDDIDGNIDFLIQEFQRHGVTLMFVEHAWPYVPDDGMDVRSIVESMKRKLRAYSEMATRDDDG